MNTIPQRRSRHDGLQRVDLDFNLKAATDQGVIEGYASATGVIDSYGEIIAAGAFERTISAWKAKGKPVPVLWQHDTMQPIGATLELEEDSKGLRIKAELILEVERAREALALAKRDVLGGMSIGFRIPMQASDGRDSVVWDDEQRAWIIREVRLMEYSLVTFPANEDATIDSIKAFLTTPPAWVGELSAMLTEVRAALAPTTKPDPAPVAQLGELLRAARAAATLEETAARSARSGHRELQDIRTLAASVAAILKERA